MKSKLFLSLLAVVIAIACAFASNSVPQQEAFYKPIGEDVTTGVITVPSNTDVNPCLTSNTEHLCMVGSRIAYETEDGAENSIADDQLKWND
ncbi:DUF6520 family protein [Chryseosolibacter indicus]|uniref:Uncharacterized protein n=1 Tax=Chryseosolibacter indicus TaxID=2782351 RepID=A0ABS5VU94_9BACT|nr:DUF6520 family protein [Chryseosolibacter indicus]MBT1704459.1 hypothetical protein [Chryseosolibacter indicus]